MGSKFTRNFLRLTRGTREIKKRLAGNAYRNYSSLAIVTNIPCAPRTRVGEREANGLQGLNKAVCVGRWQPCGAALPRPSSKLI